MYNESFSLIVEGYKSKTKAILDRMIGVSNLAAEMEDENSREIRRTIKYMIDNCGRCMPQDLDVDKMRMKTALTLLGDNHVLKLTLLNSLDAKNTFQSVRVFSDRHTYADIAEFIIDYHVELLIATAMQKNIDQVNELLAQKCAECGKDFVIEYIVPMFAKSNKPIAYISDKKIVLLANTENVFKYGDTYILFDDEEASELMKEQAQKFGNLEAERLVADIAAMDSTINVVKSKNSFLQYLGQPVTSRVCTLIRDSVPIAIDNKRSVKRATDAYWHNKEDKVFAILHRDEEGQLSLVLSPFNTETLQPVDVDVLAVVQG